ncbi:MAG TPA: hypothetical protein VGD31_12105, partial [Sphingobacteriaceae bacterium]
QSGSTALTDLSLREKSVMIALVISIIWLGLFPQTVLNTSERSVNVIGQGSYKNKDAAQQADTESISSKTELNSYE